jgi:hypothetical protein
MSSSSGTIAFMAPPSYMLGIYRHTETGFGNCRHGYREVAGRADRRVANGGVDVQRMAALPNNICSPMSLVQRRRV